MRMILTRKRGRTNPKNRTGHDFFSPYESTPYKPDQGLMTGL